MKEDEFDLEHTCEMFMEAKNNFAEASTSWRKDNLGQEMDPSMLMTFLEKCMKLLRDSKVMKGLEELINRCSRNTLGEPHMV